MISAGDSSLPTRPRRPGSAVDFLLPPGQKPRGLLPAARLLLGVTLTLIAIAFSPHQASAAAAGITYDIYRDGTLIGSVTGTSFQDTGLTAGTTHRYQVRARDGTGNRSALTGAVSAQTLTGSGNTCSILYPSDSAAPEGFGAAWNPFSPAHELLLNAACADGGLTVTAGSPAAAPYIYRTGYRWSGSAWQPYTFTGDTPAGDWYLSTARATVPLPAGPAYFVAFTCQYLANTWKCGCSDSACAVPKWQLQGVMRQG